MIDVGGGLYVWGSGAGYRLGYGGEQSHELPVHIALSAVPVQVSCGTQHTACIVGTSNLNIILYTSYEI